jgi:hypothetical protein
LAGHLSIPDYSKTWTTANTSLPLEFVLSEYWQPGMFGRAAGFGQEQTSAFHFRAAKSLYVL